MDAIANKPDFGKSTYTVQIVTKDAEKSRHLNQLLTDIPQVTFTIHHEKSIDSALKTTANNLIDITFFDLRMNGRVGTKLLKEFIDQCGKIPVVAVIDGDDQDIESACIRMGAQDVLAQEKVTAKGLMRVISHSYDRFKSTMLLANERELLRNMAENPNRSDLFDTNLSDGAALDDAGQSILSENHELLKKINSQNTLLNQLAHQDVLTNLPNRLKFEEEIKITVEHSARHRHKFALLMLDLDGFKEINDNHGHAAGDKLLRAVAQRIKNGLRGKDFVARLGGDEFSILCNEIQNELSAGIIAKNLISAIEQPFKGIAKDDLLVTASIGISCYPEDSKNLIELQQQADVAMYSAKNQGKNQFQYSTFEHHAIHIKNLKITAHLKQAIANNELYLNYQPIISDQTGKIDSMEALLRWKNPELGIIPPDVFIPLAESCGQIASIGRWVLEHACETFAEWYHNGFSDMRLALNISPFQLEDRNLKEVILNALRKAKLPLSSVDLELTESALFDTTSNRDEIINNLHDIGLACSIDDFGTGYSSLSRLQQMYFMTLKIDKSFVDGIGVAHNDEIIIELIVGLAKRLGLSIIAEGVETKQQLEFLRTLKCERFQGYYYSKPLSAADMKVYLSQSCH